MQVQLNIHNYRIYSAAEKNREFATNLFIIDLNICSIMLCQNLLIGFDLVELLREHRGALGGRHPLRTGGSAQTFPTDPLLLVLHGVK